MTNPYSKVIDDNEELAKKIYIILNNLRLRLSRANIKQIKAETERAFANIEEKAFSMFYENAKAVKQDLTKSELKKWLDDYYIVTQYVYYNELNRKKQRYIETLITLKDNEFSYNGVDAMTAQKRLAKSLSKQFEEYGVMIVDKATLAEYEKESVKRVKWVAQLDNSVCAECAKRDGKTYSIEKVPSKPHYGCRCYLVKVG